MKNHISACLTLVAVVTCHSAFAISDKKLTSVKDAIKELCETPTNKGDKFSVEGGGESGVTIKFLGIGVEGKVERSAWEGIEQYRETQSERLDCVITLAGLFTQDSPNLSETEVDNPNVHKINDLENNYKTIRSTLDGIGSNNRYSFSLSRDCIFTIARNGMMDKNFRPRFKLMTTTGNRMDSGRLVRSYHETPLGPGKYFLEIYLNSRVAGRYFIDVSTSC